MNTHELAAFACSSTSDAVKHQKQINWKIAEAFGELPQFRQPHESYGWEIDPSGFSATKTHGSDQRTPGETFVPRNRAGNAEEAYELFRDLNLLGTLTVIRHIHGFGWAVQFSIDNHQGSHFVEESSHYLPLAMVRVALRAWSLQLRDVEREAAVKELQELKNGFKALIVT